MKKRWISWMLILAMVFSTVGVHAMNSAFGELNPDLGIQKNESEFTSADSTTNELLAATPVEAALMTVADADPAGDGVTVVGQGTYTDPTAKATESYEYQILGDDGTIATVSVPAILKKLYERYVPVFDASGSATIKNGTYILIHGNPGEGRAGKGIVRSVDAAGTWSLSHSADTKGDFDETPLIIEHEYPNYEWQISNTSSGITVSFETEEGKTKYLSVSGNGVEIVDTETTVSMLENTSAVYDEQGKEGAVLIGNGSNFLNYIPSGLGTWSGVNDPGNGWYLYELKYEILDDAITTAKGDIVEDENLYSVASWTAYQNALNGTAGRFASETEAVNAYNALDAAVKGLKPVDANDVVGKVYERYEPEFDNNTSKQVSIPDGTYIILSGNPDSTVNRDGHVIIRSVDANGSWTVSHNNTTRSYFVTTPKIIELAWAEQNEEENCEWQFTTTNDNITASFKAADGNVKYMSVSSGLQIADGSTSIIVRKNTKNVFVEDKAGAVVIGNGSTYLNYLPGGFGVYNDQSDAGNAWYLYALKYSVKENALRAETAKVVSDASVYTSETWSDYQTALEKAGELYATERAAEAAYDALVKAVAELELAEGLTLEKIRLRVGTNITVDGLVKSTPSNLGIVGIQENVEYDTNPATSFEPSAKYRITTVGGRALRNEISTQYPSSWAQGFQLGDGNEAEHWKITVVSETNGAYKVNIQDQDGWYFNFNEPAASGNTAALLKDTPQTIDLNQKESGMYSISYTSTHTTYLNNYGGTTYNSHAAGYSNSSITDANGWRFYKASNTGTTVLTGKTIGNTVVVIGGKIYEITVHDDPIRTSYTMKELYDAICKANQEALGLDEPQFLYSEEVYTSETGRAYREALEAARGTFTAEGEAEAALKDLTDAVKGLTLKTGMKSVFPEITWQVTEETMVNGAANYVENETYLNNGPYDANGDGEADFDKYEALTWKWTTIQRLINDADQRISPVWTTDDKGLSYRKYSESASNDNWLAGDFYKISGTFTWPEGYDLNNTTILLDSKNDFYYRDIYEKLEEDGIEDYFPLGQVLPVDDDVYVVLWAEEGPKPTVDTINDHLAFWAGTSGKGVWSFKKDGEIHIVDDYGRTEPATFVEWNLQGERTFRNSYPNIIGLEPIEDTEEAKREANSKVESWDFEYLEHTKGWYTLTDTTSVNSVLRNNYGEIGFDNETVVHIDLYVMDNGGSGTIDELEIELFTADKKEPQVTVNYYLKDGTTQTLLGSEHLLHKAVGDEIDILPGFAAGQLNSYKAEAVAQAGYRSVTNGVQMNELVVTEDDAKNVVNVVYTVEGQKTVYLTAPSEEYEYDGTAKSLTTVEVTVLDNGKLVKATPLGDEFGTYRLPDGNYIRNVHSRVVETYPGKYANNFIMENGQASTPVVYEANEDGTINLHAPLNNYTIEKIPGTLEITYDPVEVTNTYDFGVKNVYADVLTEAELEANITIEGNANIEFYGSAVSYTPSAANAGETVNVVLSFEGGYEVTKTLNFLPATNVLYEENFVTATPVEVNGELKNDWSTTVAAERSIKDNASTVYGYSDAYKNDNAYSNGATMMAELTLNGNFVETVNAASFSFIGTGFDLISACGTNTGMLLVRITDPDGKAKFQLIDTYFTGDGELISGEGILAHQVPILREMYSTYGKYKVDIWGYLASSSGAATYGFGRRMSVTTEDIVMAALDSAGLLDEVDVADVEVSFIDENSMLNGGTGCATGSGIATFGLTRDGGENEPTATTAYVYVDGFRVYGALQDETNYAANEQGVKFASVYDFAQNSAGDLVEDEYIYDSMLYVEYDGAVDVAAIAQYKNQGPQNEVYLTEFNAIGFVLEGYEEGMTVMVSAKAISDGAILGVMNNEEWAFEPFGESLASAEMYYDISDYVVEYDTEKYMIAFRNEGAGVLSISELKLDKDIAPAAAAEAGVVVEKALEDSNEQFDFVPDRFEVSYNDAVTTGRTTSITVKTSLPVADEPEKTVAKVELLDEDGNVVKEFNLSNKAAVNKGKATYCSYSASVKVTEDVKYQVVAYNENGDASAPLEVTITAQ